MDVATLGLAIDTSKVKDGILTLREFGGAADRAWEANISLGKASKATGDAVRAEGAAVETTAGAFDRMASEISNIDALNRRMAISASSSGRALSTLGGEVLNTDRLLGSLIDEVQRTNAALLGMSNMRPGGGGGKRPFKEMADDIDNIGGKTKIANHHLTNMGYQFQDIGVQLAGGQNPLLIMVQQGSQLSQIFAQMSAEAGGSRAALNGLVGVVGRLSIRAFALVPPIAAAIATYKTFMSDFRRGLDDMTKGLGLTKDQLELVSSKTVSFGDVMRATMKVAGEDIKSAFGPQLDWLGKRWVETQDLIGQAMHFMMDRAWEASSVVSGVFNVALKNVTENWKLFPGVLGDIFFTAVNAGIKALEGLINKGVEGVNYLIEAQNRVNPAFKMPAISPVKFGEFNNPFKGQAAKLGAKMADDFSDGYDAQMGRRERIRARSQVEARDRINREAHSKDKKKKGSGDQTFEAPWMQMRRNDAIDVDPAKTFKKSLDDVQAKFELMPGAIDPVLAKLDSMRESAVGFGEDLAYGVGSAAAGIGSWGDAVTGALKRAWAQWVTMKTLGFLGIDSTSGELKKGGLLDKGVSVLASTFGLGKREMGGPVTAGRPYIVGERRPELFVPRQSGFIVPQVPQMSGHSMNYAPSINISGITSGELQAELAGVLARDRKRVLDQARRQLPGQMGNLNKLGTTRA